ncbi:MAG: PHP domain-containing protein [Victivallaceae bacterium]|nr:PHP domain-containing protein [Victivallaceae bacterium]
MIFYSDMHIHTTASTCCDSKVQTPENIIPIMIDKGYKKIGFTDHIWYSDEVRPSKFYSSQNGDRHLQLHKFIHSHKWEIEVLAGCEADMKAPGIFGITAELKDKLDYVTMATDHFHMKGFVMQPSEETPAGVARHMVAFFVSAAKSGLPDILAHPFFPYGYTDLYDAAVNSLSDAEIIDVFSIAASNNIGIEINKCYFPHPQYKRFFSLETPVRILTLAKSAGCKFTLGSDAHSPDGFKVLDKLQTFAKSLGLSEKDIHPLAKTG